MVDLGMSPYVQWECGSGCASERCQGASHCLAHGLGGPEGCSVPLAWAVPPHRVPDVGAAALGAMEGGVPASAVLLASRWGFPAWQPWHRWHRSRCPPGAAPAAFLGERGLAQAGAGLTFHKNRIRRLGWWG